MTVLVIAEHDNKNLLPATLNTVTAAKAFNEDITVLVAGSDAQNVVEQAQKISGVSKVLSLQNAQLEHQLAEDLAPQVQSLAAQYNAVLAPASTFGKNLLPRIAALLDVQAVSDVLAIESSDTFKRPIYAGNVIATVQALDDKKLLTIRATAFEPAEISDQNASVEEVSMVDAAPLTAFVKEELAQSDRPDLGSANIVVSGGRGLLSGENFKMMYTLADKLEAAVGASRAAVDAGFVPNDMQVGQTGKVVAPDLYIAVGISGAIQHLAGMKDSKVIVAINRDEEAPIFQVADYGLVADLFEVVPELIEKL